MIRRKSIEFPVLLCWIILLNFVSSSPSRVFLPPSPGSPKVSLGLYYESLCPYCSNFIINHLVKLFDDDLISIVDLHLSPWGNAKLHADNVTFACQHGPLECELNTVEACAIEVWPELSDHFRFIYCIESLEHEGKSDKWETCYDKLRLHQKPVADCISSGRGKELELQYAAETDALRPPHKYVPWVVVDGQPLYEDYENFISYVCKAYKGTEVPKACSQLSSNALHETQVKHLRLPSVCRKGTQISTSFERLKSAVKSLIHKMNMAGLV